MDDWDAAVLEVAVEGDNGPSVEIIMPSDYFMPGDPCYINGRLWIPGYDPEPELPLFGILDVFGSYFFWPDWTDTVTWENHPLMPGASQVAFLPEFPWPENAGTVTGIGFYAALTNPEMSALYGDFGYTAFGWGQ